MLAYFKKIVFITFLLSLAFRAFAPTAASLIIFEPAPVEPFKKLINAIGMVETQYDTLAFNPEEEAVGFFQIRPIRLLDYNKRTGSTLSRNDLFRYSVSEKIFLYYASDIGPYDFERVARSWNGSGESTLQYWEQVKKYLDY